MCTVESLPQVEYFLPKHIDSLRIKLNPDFPGFFSFDSSIQQILVD